MNRKTLLAFTLALTTLGSTTAITYASQDSVNTTKNVVVTVEDKEVKNNTASIKSTIMVDKRVITDEEAIQMAAKALKDYVGKDSDFFAEAKINRTNATETKKGMEVFQNQFSKEDAVVYADNMNKHIANVINVVFTPTDTSNNGRNLVTINEETGELVVVGALYNFDEKIIGEIDDVQVKEATLSFFNQLGKKIIGKYVQVQKNIEYGMVEVICQLDDGREASLLINVKDYSVIHYQVNFNNFTTLPSEEKERKESYKELQIN